MKTRGPYELKNLMERSHYTVTLLNHIQDYGSPIDISRYTNMEHPKKAFTYGAHDLVAKEKSYYRKNLLKPLWARNVVILPLEDVHHLQVLWLSPLLEMTQTGRKPCLVYNFPWRGLKNVSISLLQRRQWVWMGTTPPVRLHT